MRITLTMNGGTYRCRRPHREAAFVVSTHRCACGANTVAGITGAVIETRDTYRSDAVCTRCRASLGVLRVKVSTLFGLEEDERVLSGRCRVY